VRNVKAACAKHGGVSPTQPPAPNTKPADPNTKPLTAVGPTPPTQTDAAAAACAKDPKSDACKKAKDAKAAAPPTDPAVAAACGKDPKSVACKNAKDAKAVKDKACAADPKSAACKNTGANKPADPKADPKPKPPDQPPKQPVDPKANVSPAQMQKCMPGLSSGLAGSSSPYMDAAMADAGINTPARKAAFLAQLGHESGSLHYMQEIASGAAYEGRRDLGNTQPGDGRRYKGRGPIQLTGRANYAAAGRALGIDLINHPELAATPAVGFRTSAWFWKTHGLNQLADAGNFHEITHRINGGQNGAADREHRYALCKQALGQ